MSSSKKDTENKNYLERFWLPIILALLTAASPIIIEIIKNNQTDNSVGSNQAVVATNTENLNVGNQFLQFLGNNPSKEEIISFVENNPEILNGIPQDIDYDVHSVLFRFNVAENQIPDVTIFNLRNPQSQLGDNIIFVDFKSPSASLFKGDNVKSDDLQGAWDESLQYIKSAADNFDDFSWRVLKDKRLDPPLKLLEWRTEFSAVIVIGRRDSLTKSEIEQIQKINEEELISIITYDTLLDSVSKK